MIKSRKEMLQVVRDNIGVYSREELFNLAVSAVGELGQRGLNFFQMVTDRYNKLRQKEMEVR